MTALLPTRWTFSFSTNLIHLQVDAEIQVAMESAEEDETEVLKSPLAKNKKTSNVCFCIYRPIRPSTKHQKSSFQVWCSDRVQQQLKQSSRAKFRKLREHSEKYLWNPRLCKIVQDLWQRESENSTQNWNSSALGRFHLCDLIVVLKFTFWHVRKGTYFIIIIW